MPAPAVSHEAPSISPEDAAAAVLQFGYAPTADAGVSYQPDVVLIANGPAAIRSVTSDGLVFTMDRRFPGVDDLAVGNVMFAAANAVGRVVELREDSESRVVVLAPVDLTEVVTDLELHLDQAIDLDNLVYQEVPDRPDVAAERNAAASPAASPDASPESSDVVTLPPIRLVAYDPHDLDAAIIAGSATGALPKPIKSSITVPLGQWTVKLYGGGGKMGLTATRSIEGGLKVNIDLAVNLADDFRVTPDTVVKDGETQRSGFLIHGLKGLDVSVSAGVANASTDNTKVKFEVPVEVNFPLPPEVSGGIPANIKLTYSYFVETALVGNNSTLFATGKYGLDGDLGMSNGELKTPTFSVIQGIVDSISGLTLGPSGIAFGFKVKMMAGIGTPAATVGPYATFTDSMGLTNGSSLGAPLARCHGATLDLKAGGGIGISVSPSSILFSLKNLVSKTTKLPPTTKIEHGIEVENTFLHRAQVVPDVPLCNA